ncbi:gamma-glutamylcyclotransferase [Gammaproteobacteria bacterium]|nr:gamma-glutamylcyclotransferase [Gammaproteobacteria bacterium]
MPPTLDYIFVYGTLRSDSNSENYHRLIAPEFTLVNRATLPGRLYLITDYPGLLRTENNNEYVVGELYAFSGGESRLAALDEYEECATHSPQPHLYTRTRESVSLSDGSVYSAWVYFYNLPVAEDRLIRSGDFLDPF